MSDSELLQIIEQHEKIHPQFKDGDLAKKIVALQSERLKDAAQMIGREWNGTFSNAHVEIIARSYHEAISRIVRKAGQPR